MYGEEQVATVGAMYFIKAFTAGFEAGRGGCFAQRKKVPAIRIDRVSGGALLFAAPQFDRQARHNVGRSVLEAGEVSASLRHEGNKRSMKWKIVGQIVKR